MRLVLEFLTAKGGSIISARAAEIVTLDEFGLVASATFGDASAPPEATWARFVENGKVAVEGSIARFPNYDNQRDTTFQAFVKKLAHPTLAPGDAP